MTKQTQPDNKMLCQQYLTGLYASIQHQHPHHHKKVTQIAETYGEILYPSIEKIIDNLSLTEQDAFFDLGSGMGKLISQIFLRTPIKHACGIELLPELHQLAMRASTQIYQDLPEFYNTDRKLTLIQGDILTTPLTSATVALIASPCFPLTILDPLGELINNTHSIHTFLSLKPIRTLQRLKFRKAIHLQCSWDSAICYLYR